MFDWFKKRGTAKPFNVLLMKGASSDNVLREFMIDGDPAVWTDRSYMALAKEGYSKNVIAYRCINAIATACADIPIIIKVNGNEIEDPVNSANKLARMIVRPNPTQSYKTFMEMAVAYRLIGGNTYIHLLQGRINGTPYELNLFRPDRVQIDTDGYCIPIDYRYEMNGIVKVYPIDSVTRLSEVLQIKCFNPRNDLYGQSPLSVAIMSVDQHNSASMWNKRLLDNYSKPAGILTLKDRGDNAPAPTREQQQLITNQINEKFQGPENAGKILFLNYDLDWKSLSFNPSEMDWLNGKNSSARDICLAFGYPSFLLGLPDANSTFNNVEQAKLALYEETVIPTLNLILSEMSYWLSQMLKTNISIEPDLDKVSALTPRRQVARDNARQDVLAGIISINEAREEMNYEPVDGGDEILIPAAKLPLNFDMTGLNEKQFTHWLIKEGMTEEAAIRYAKLAYTKEAK